MTGILVFVLRVLLALCLYAFLGWGLYTLWRELKANQILVSAQKIPAIRVTITEAEQTQTREFTAPQLFIGRDPSCEICLHNEMVSGQHARISFHHSQWWVEDLHSTNGTYLNDERVYTPTVLISGDELRCGQISLEVAFGEPSSVLS